MCDFIGLVQIFEVQLRPVYAGGVTVLFESFDGFTGVFFFLGEKDDFRGVVLEDVSCDTETNASGTPCDDVDLVQGEEMSRG